MERLRERLDEVNWHIDYYKDKEYAKTKRVLLLKERRALKKRATFKLIQGDKFSW